MAVVTLMMISSVGAQPVENEKEIKELIDAITVPYGYDRRLTVVQLRFLAPQGTPGEQLVLEIFAERAGAGESDRFVRQRAISGLVDYLPQSSGTIRTLVKDLVLDPLDSPDPNERLFGVRVILSERLSDPDIIDALVERASAKWELSETVRLDAVITLSTLRADQPSAIDAYIRALDPRIESQPRIRLAAAGGLLTAQPFTSASLSALKRAANPLYEQDPNIREMILRHFSNPNATPTPEAVAILRAVRPFQSDKYYIKRIENVLESVEANVWK
jgi:hypothetical protein